MRIVHSLSPQSLTLFSFLRTGQATLSFVFLVGGITLVVALLLTFLLISVIASGAAYGRNIAAQAAADAGIRDALLRLARDKDFAAAAGYMVPVGGLTATVTVLQGQPAAGYAQITATVSASGVVRSSRAVVAVDGTSGRVRVVKWE